jgi:hypothetical protein
MGAPHGLAKFPPSMRLRYRKPCFRLVSVLAVD